MNYFFNIIPNAFPFFIHLLLDMYSPQQKSNPTQCADNLITPIKYTSSKSLHVGYTGVMYPDFAKCWKCVVFLF